ncbi:MDR family MFS transporter [Paenibacillus sp. KN14-4R]|uniref:MDR family MFS transporter n=1 Tax=Paenibacillus sp. KN14-4R TaxID=3445773 RepID=UPI003F9EC384
MTAKPLKVGLVTTGLLMGLILSSLDQTIVSTAMPTIVKGLGSGNLYSWVFAIYMLASTTTMPIYGKLADLFGRRRMYLVGLVMFLIGSLLCGFAGSMMELIVYRGIQGLGAGALMPITFTIVADIFPPERRGKFMGLFGTVFAISSIFGPTLGGILVDYGHWSSIFLINLPIGIGALIVLTLGLRENRKQADKRSIDWLGVITLSGAIISILLVLEIGRRSQIWNDAPTIGLFVGGVVLMALFIWIETKAKEPIIPLKLFQLRTIAYGNIAGFFVSAGMLGAIAYIPLYVQEIIGVSPSIAGYILTPLMLSTVVTSTLSGWLMNRLSYRAILMCSLMLMVVGFILLGQMGVETTKTEIILYMVITGLGMGAVYPTIGTAAGDAVDWQLRGAATSSSQFFRSLGGTIGVSVLGSFLTEEMTWHTSVDKAALSGTLDQIFIYGAVFVGISLLASIGFGNARLVQRKVVKENVKIS